MLVVAMQIVNQLFESWLWKGIRIVGKVSVEVIDVYILPHALKRNVGIAVTLYDGAHYRNVLVAPSALVEAECPVLSKLSGSNCKMSRRRQDGDVLPSALRGDRYTLFDIG